MKCNMSALGLLLAAGFASSATASLSVTPSDVLVWGNTGIGRSTAGIQPAGVTWSWFGGLSGSGRPDAPIVGADGRVYWIAQYRSSAAGLAGGIGTANSTTNRALLTATNSGDMAVFGGLYDASTYSANSTTYNLSNIAGTTGGLTSTTPRIAGNTLGYGLQVSGGSPAIVETPAASANNTMFNIGSYGAGGLSKAAQQLDSVTLNDTNSNATAVNFTTALKSISQQNCEINSAGTMLAWLSVPAAAGTGSPLAGQFVTTANATAPAPYGNTGFLATKTVSGGYNVIAQGGQLAGIGAARFQNGNNGVNGFFSKINRDGDVAFDGKLVTSIFGTTTSNDDVAYIWTASTNTKTLVRREGQAAPDTTGSPDAGGALYSGGITTGSHSFSNYGLLFGSSLTSGDVVTTAGSANDVGTYVATTSGARRIARRNDPVPGAPANVNFGQINSSAMSINNNGDLLLQGSLQGSAVTANVGFQYNQFGDGLITSTGTMGSDSAVFTGNAATGLRIVARMGDAIPGTPYYFGQFSNNGSYALNNAGEFLFSNDASAYGAGQAIGVVGQTPAASVLAGGPTILWGYSPTYGLVSMMYVGEQIEVEPGVFRTVSQFNVSATDNGDGGASGLNDSGRFAVNCAFSDGSWGIVYLQIPAPGTGMMALLGLGALARRRRSN